MKRYQITVFGDGDFSRIEMDLRPTEFKTVERVAGLILASHEGLHGEPWMDIEEV